MKLPAVPQAKHSPCVHLRDRFDTLIQEHICFLNIYVFLRVEKKEDRNSLTNKAHIFLFSSFYHPLLQPQELPRAPGAIKIAEVGESWCSSTQTGCWLPLPPAFTEGKVVLHGACAVLTGCSYLPGVKSTVSGSFYCWSSGRQRAGSWEHPLASTWQLRGHGGRCLPFCFPAFEIHVWNVVLTALKSERRVMVLLVSDLLFQNVSGVLHSTECICFQPGG